MSREENIALVQGYTDEIANKRNLDAVDQFVAADFVDHSMSPEDPSGPEVVKEALTMFYSAFPDFEITTEETLAEGDKVVVRANLAGTHQGAFRGIPPTGKRFSAQAIFMFRIADNKLVERWSWMDTVGMMQQLGLMPG